MPSYKYRVIFEDGKIGHGKIMALNKSHAMESLKKENIQPIYIKKMAEKKDKEKKKETSSLDTKKIIESVNHKENNGKINLKKITLKELQQIELHPFSRVTSKDIIIFVNNLYILQIYSNS